MVCISLSIACILLTVSSNSFICAVEAIAPAAGAIGFCIPRRAPALLMGIVGMLPEVLAMGAGALWANSETADKITRAAAVFLILISIPILL